MEKTGGTYNIILENRERLSLTGVTEVKSFDDDRLSLDTAGGALQISGHGLHVEKLSLETGELTVVGLVDSVRYTGAVKEKGGFFSKLF